MHPNVLSLKEWWEKSNDSQASQADVKVRFVGWDHRIRFLKLVKFDDKTATITGELDSGEKVSYPAESPFWVAYDDGMEEEARAV